MTLLGGTGLLGSALPGLAQSDWAVTYHMNPLHTGQVTTPRLTPPFMTRWTADLGADVSYPLIAEGKVFATAGTPGNQSSSLYAFDAATGSTLWGPVTLTGTYGETYPAYDAGKVFAVNFDGVLRAFNAGTGQQIWSVQLPGQYAFSSAPTARNGMVYVGGAGIGGTLYAVNETNGAVVWTQPVANGDDSSPTVTASNVFVAYAGAQAYKFDAASGSPLWHYNGYAEGGGGATAPLYNGSLYIRDDYSQASITGTVLNAANGNVVSHFPDNGSISAFDNGARFFLQNNTLSAVYADTGNAQWSMTEGQDTFTTAPIVVNNIVYMGTSTGKLFGFNETTGQVVWSTSVGAPVSQESERVGMAAGQSLLVVPAGHLLVAYGAVTDKDINGDNKPDFLWQNQATGQLLTWDMNDTQTVQYGPVFATVSDLNWKVVATPDMNGDGHPDLLWQNQATGQLLVWYMNGTQVTQYGSVFATVSDLNWKVVAAPDMNNDGYPDLLWQNQKTGQLLRWLMNNTQVIDYSSVFATVSDTSWKIVAAPDMNSDGRSDILWQNQKTGAVVRWTMKDRQVLQYGSAFATVSDLNWKIVGAADMNGDGHADIVWQNAATGQLTRWLMNDQAIIQNGPTFNQVSDLNWKVVAVP